MVEEKEKVLEMACPVKRGANIDDAVVDEAVDLVMNLSLAVLVCLPV